MSEHVTDWLEAYQDGELHGLRLHQVENHLAECAACQTELEALAGLSALLTETPPVGDFLPTERFVANLTLNLPRQTETPQPRKMLEFGWWLIPFGVLGTWVFLQITFSLSYVALTAANAGLLGNNLAWLQGNPPQMAWFATLTDLFGNQLGFTGTTLLSALNRADVFVMQWSGWVFGQVLLAVLYLGWLAVWWLKSHPQAAQNPGIFSQS
jgi:hypothetical protein